MTFSVLRRYVLSTTREMLVEDEPCAQATERAEELAGHAYAMLEVLADHGHGGKAVFEFDRVDGPAGNLLAEFVVESRPGQLRVILAYAYRDARL